MRALLPATRLPRALAASLLLYLFIYLWSVPMLMFDLVPAWGQGMGGLLLILQGMISAVWLQRAAGRGGLGASAAILALAYLVELVGVSWGWPFGRYAYTRVLGLQLGGAVPLAIPFAWLLVVPGAVLWAQRIVGGRAAVPVAALLALLLDLLIEPVAAHVAGYWRWLDGGSYYGVPWTNFVAWGLTACVLAVVLRLLAPELRQEPREPWLPRLLFALNAVQFTLVDAAYGFWWAALAGAGLLAILISFEAHAKTG